MPDPRDYPPTRPLRSEPPMTTEDLEEIKAAVRRRRLMFSEETVLKGDVVMRGAATAAETPATRLQRRVKVDDARETYERIKANLAKSEERQRHPLYVMGNPSVPSDVSWLQRINAQPRSGRLVPAPAETGGEHIAGEPYDPFWRNLARRQALEAAIQEVPTSRGRAAYYCSKCRRQAMFADRGGVPSPTEVTMEVPPCPSCGEPFDAVCEIVGGTMLGWKPTPKSAVLPPEPEAVIGEDSVETVAEVDAAKTGRALNAHWYKCSGPSHHVSLIADEQFEHALYPHHILMCRTCNAPYLQRLEIMGSRAEWHAVDLGAEKLRPEPGDTEHWLRAMAHMWRNELMAIGWTPPEMSRDIQRRPTARRRFSETVAPIGPESPDPGGFPDTRVMEHVRDRLFPPTQPFLPAVDTDDDPL